MAVSGVSGRPRRWDLTVVGQVMSTMLPYELIGMIVDYFETDKAELAKCTLIARSWVQPGRYHLFRTLTIVQAHGDDDRLAAFRRFLESERGQPYAPYVQGLCLRGVPPADDVFWEPTLDLHALGAVVHALSRLQVVNLDRVRLAGLPADAPAPQTCESVVRLNIARICTWTFHDVKDCVDIVHLFPGLQHFYTDNLGRYVDETGRECEGPPPKDHIPFSPKLQLSEVTHKTFGPSSSLLDYFSSAFNLANLTTLVLWHLLPSEIASVGCFLAKVGSSLRRLDISLADCFIPEAYEGGYYFFQLCSLVNRSLGLDTVDPQPLWKGLQLPKCEVLETFLLYIALDYDPELPRPSTEFHPHWFSAELILARLPPSVQELHLALQVDNEPEWLEEVLHDVDWRRVARALARLPALRKVFVYTEDRRVGWYRTPVEDWTQELVCAKLPDAQARGVLDFSCPPIRAW